MKTSHLRKPLRVWGRAPFHPCIVVILGLVDLSGGLTIAAETGTGGPGRLHGVGGWTLSEKKGAEAPASPLVVAPGLGGSRRAARFELVKDNEAACTSAEHSFPLLSGEKLTVELTVLPSSDHRGLGMALRGGRGATAYLRFNAGKSGWCEHYGPDGVYRNVAPFQVGKPNRVRMELNTKTCTLKAWVNGTGGDAWPFRAKVDSVDRIDLFMTHGRGQGLQAVIDDIAVRDDEGKVVFAEDFEQYVPRPDNAREGGEGPVKPLPPAADMAEHVLLSDDFDTYQAGVLVGQGGWARSEDLEEATKQAEIIRPGLGGSGGALFLREKGEGASKALSRAVGEETIVVEFDFLPATLQRPLTLGLRAGPVGDDLRGKVSAHLKLDGGKCFLLKKPPAKWTAFEGVSWEAGKRVHVRLIVDYAANLARIEVDDVRSPTAIGDWWTQAKPANVDITAQFGTGGSTLDNLVVTVLAGGASKLPQ